MTEDLFAVESRPEPGAGETPNGETIVLRLHVQPGAGRAAVVGRYGDALHVRVAPPPANGRANDAVVELVAELLGVGRDAVELVGGATHRDKRVRVHGVDPEAARLVLDEAIERAATTPGSVRGGHGRR